MSLQPGDRVEYHYYSELRMGDWSPDNRGVGTVVDATPMVQREAKRSYPVHEYNQGEYFVMGDGDGNPPIIHAVPERRLFKLEYERKIGIGDLPQEDLRILNHLAKACDQTVVRRSANNPNPYLLDYVVWATGFIEAARSENSPEQQLKRQNELLSILQVKQKKFVEKHEADLRISFPGTLMERVAYIVQHYEDKALRSMSHTEQYQQELLTMFRALNLIIDTVFGAGSHKEKDARLRGVSELIENCYEKVRKWRIDVQSSLPPWSYSSVFQNNYLDRHYLDRINALEAELARVKGETKPVHDTHDHSDPFGDS